MLYLLVGFPVWGDGWAGEIPVLPYITTLLVKIILGTSPSA